MSALFPETVETDRLLLERLCHENVDALDLYECFAAGVADEEVFEYVPQDAWHTPKEAHDRIEDAEERWRESRAAEYVVRPRESEARSASEQSSEEQSDPRDGEPRTGKIAGTAHLHCEWDRQTGRLGLILRKPFWGRGYSGERANALMELAFDRLDLGVVEAGCNAGNKKSKWAIEKYVERFGGQYEGRLRNWVPMSDRVDDYHRYTVTCEQWERNRSDEGDTATTGE